MSNLRFRTSLGGGWVALALLLGPVASAAAQRSSPRPPPPGDPVLRPGDALRIDVWRHPEQSVEFVVEPLFPVTIAGEVRQPNLYRLPQGTTFAQAVAKAGGPTELGRLDKVHVIRRDSAVVINLANGYSRYGALPVASGDQVLVSRRSNFNLLRDILYPAASLTAAVAAILAYSRLR